MNGLAMLQLGLSAMVLTIFLGYAFHILAYVFGYRSVIDERLKRYGRATEGSGDMRWILPLRCGVEGKRGEG
ncbi:MAG: hypothetical protein A2Z14_06830 [Chloroflexi bacterium RBG_16_48_8]|nr:MAG: hypothetical protein A2Z14_06830 [Chloroflexi bacterium RBG_16_48_8]